MNRIGTALKKIIFFIFPIVCTVGLVYSTYRFLTQYNEYRKAKEEYAGLLDETIAILGESQADAQEKDAKGAGTGGAIPETNINSSSDTGSDGGSSAQAKEPQPFEFPCPALKIDYTELQNMNPDFVGVLYLPALEICYPVAHSHDNLEYLRRTFSGSVNASGCIFLDRYDSAAMDDQFSIIFGHNMKNGTMFGSLKTLANDPAICEADPYFYLYTPEGVYVYRIFAYGQIPSNDEIYDLPPQYYDADQEMEMNGQEMNDQELDDQEKNGQEINDQKNKQVFANNTTIRTYEDLLQHLRSRSVGTIDLDEAIISEKPSITMLSTCWGTNHVYNFIVSGVLLGRADS